MDSVRWARARAILAERQQEAQREAARAEEVLDLTLRMIGGASPDDVKAKDSTLRALLDDIDAGLPRRVVVDPQVEGSVRQILGRA